MQTQPIPILILQPHELPPGRVVDLPHGYTAGGKPLGLSRDIVRLQDDTLKFRQ